MLYNISECRFDTLEPEMNNVGARVNDVNQVAEQLLNSENCNKDQIHQTKDKLNNRSELVFRVYLIYKMYVYVWLCDFIFDQGFLTFCLMLSLDGKSLSIWLVKRNKLLSLLLTSRTTT